MPVVRIHPGSLQLCLHHALRELRVGRRVVHRRSRLDRLRLRLLETEGVFPRDRILFHYALIPGAPRLRLRRHQQQRRNKRRRPCSPRRSCHNSLLSFLSDTDVPSR